MRFGRLRHEPRQLDSRAARTPPRDWGMVLGAAEPKWFIDEIEATTRPLPANVLENSPDLGAWRLEQKALAH